MQKTEVLDLSLYEQECYEFTKVLDAFKSNLGVHNSNMQKIDNFAKKANTAIKDETDRAIAAEKNLQNQIDTNKPIWDDKYTKAEINNKFAMLEQNIDWKESVNTFNDIATTYPNPQDGWTVNVKDTDYTYRWSGSKWVVISANAIPQATTAISGIVKVDDNLSTSSRNPVENRIVTNELNFMKDEYGNLIFIGTYNEYEDANRKGLIKNGTVVHITDDFDDDVLIIDSILSSISKNPVENKVIKAELDKKLSLTGGTITGDLIIDGITLLKNTLGVTGKVTLDDSLQVTGTTILNDTLTVTKGVTLKSALGIGGDVTINGKITGNSSMLLKGNTEINMYSYTGIPLKVYGGDIYGQGISIGSGGATIVGGGESAKACESLLPASTEELWLTSDSIIRFYTNCNNIDNKQGVILNGRDFYPDITGYGNLGTPTNKWANIYINTLNASSSNIGNITIADGISFTDIGANGNKGITGSMANNDNWYIKGFSTSVDQSYLEIATGDNGNEPIYVSQYTSGNTLSHRAILLDGSGNTSFPGKLSCDSLNITKDVTISGNLNAALSGNADTATKSTKDSRGQQIDTTYIKKLSVSGKTITYTKGDDSTGTISTQDTWRGIQDNLTSTSTVDSLSASQGKVLNDKINNMVFVGTKTEYENKKNSITNGAVVVLTDD